MSAVLSATQPAAAPDFAAIKTRQQAAWSTGDYAVVGTTLQIVGEDLCEALDLRSGSKVLDVAAGNGNATLAAARRWCDVTSTDYVGSLLESGRARAQAAFARDVMALIDSRNRSGDATLVLRSEYVEVVVVRS